MSVGAGIYLDSNAGAPLRPEAVDALKELLAVEDREAGVLIPNPSSIHSHGRKAKRLLAEARDQVAFSLGPKTDPEQIVFTSSGTEANQLAVRAILEPKLVRGERPHWITTPVEHDSNLELTKWVEARGGSVSYLPVDSDGDPMVGELSALWRQETALVSVIWVNNETGVITNIASLGREVSSRNGILHLDAAQAWGKIPLDAAATGAKLVSVSGHKVGGLAGTGALWVGRGVALSSMLAGKQEYGRRGGTENLFGVVALGAAAASLRPLEWAERVAPLRDRLEMEICKLIAGVRVNGGGAKRVANTLNLSFDGVEGDSLVMALDLAGFSVSAGAACSSGVMEPSHVLMAMGRTRAQAMAALRVSLPGDVRWEALEAFVETLRQVVARVRKNFEKGQSNE